MCPESETQRFGFRNVARRGDAATFWTSLTREEEDNAQ